MIGNPDRQRGIALILVIWAVTLLATIAVVISADGRAARQVAGNLELAARARALAEGGVWWGIARLQDTDPATALRVDGHVYTLPLAGEAVKVVVEDESGKIDINHAAAPFLSALLRHCGVGEPEAKGLASAVLAHRRQHAERGPAQTAAFATTVDLRRVTGISYETFICLEPAITVHSGSAGIDPRTASPLALMAVPGLNPQIVQRYLTERAAGQPEGAAHAALTGSAEAAAYLARSPLGVVTVRSTAQLNNGAAHVSSAVVELRRNQQPSILLHHWQ